MNNIGNYIKNYLRTSDRKWFEKLYKEVMPGIYRYYYYKTFNRDLSEDLTSEVFVRVYGNLRNTNLNERSFMVWIYRIANNILIDHFRKNREDSRPVEQIIGNLTIQDENILKKESALLRKELGFEGPHLISAMNKLTGLQKDVLILRFVEDMDYSTIARIFKKTKGTIRGIIFRAIERLRKELNADDK